MQARLGYTLVKLPEELHSNVCLLYSSYSHSVIKGHSTDCHSDKGHSARVCVNVELFYASLIFAGKAGVYPSEATCGTPL